MNAIEVAQNNFNSWNRHDADAIVAAYAKGGTYRTPRMDHGLTGQAIGDFAKSVWAAFPDASLEMISIGDTGGGLVITMVGQIAMKNEAEMLKYRNFGKKSLNEI